MWVNSKTNTLTPLFFVGLEKMERDKQKQIEREREKQESETCTEKVKLSEKDAMEIIKSTVKENKARYVGVFDKPWKKNCNIYFLLGKRERNRC